MDNAKPIAACSPQLCRTQSLLRKATWRGVSMSATLTIHSSTTGLMVSRELPWNGFSIGLISADGVELSLHVTLENWWLLRGLPKAKGYFYSPSKDDDSISAFTEADAAALKFYLDASQEFSARRQTGDCDDGSGECRS